MKQIEILKILLLILVVFAGIFYVVTEKINEDEILLAARPPLTHLPASCEWSAEVAVEGHVGTPNNPWRVPVGKGPQSECNSDFFGDLAEEYRDEFEEFAIGSCEATRPSLPECGSMSCVVYYPNPPNTPHNEIRECIPMAKSPGEVGGSCFIDTSYYSFHYINGECEIWYVIVAIGWGERGCDNPCSGLAVRI
jgi:hypothetical protein